jgi:hypothetical protein
MGNHHGYAYIEQDKHECRGFLRFLGFQCYGVLFVLLMLSGDTLEDAIHECKLDTPASVKSAHTLVCEQTR